MVGQSNRGRAGGFGTGLVHGALLCGAALAALSLVLPQPDVRLRPADDGIPQAAARPDEAVSDSPIVAPATPAPATTDEASPADMVDTGSPTDGAATRLTIPRGSEFARDGVDTGPLLPAPLEQGRPGSAVMESPVVIAPVAEQAPATASSSGQRPQTRIQSPDPAAGVVDTINGPDLPLAETAIPVAPVGQVRTPGLDRLPEIGSPSIFPVIPPGSVRGEGQSEEDSEATALPQDQLPRAEPGRAPSLDRLPEIGTPSVAPAGAVTAPPVQATERAPEPVAGSTPGNSDAGDQTGVSDAESEPSANPEPQIGPSTPGLPEPGSDLREPPDLSDIRP